MCLVSGDQENLSSMPRGMKIISELQDIEWKKTFGSADMCNSLHGATMGSAATACSMDTLTHQPSQTGVGRKKNKPSSHLVTARESCDQHMDTLWQRETHLNSVWEHSVTHRQRLPPALWWQADRTAGRERWKIRDSCDMIHWIFYCLPSCVRVRKCELTGNTHWHIW